MAQARIYKVGDETVEDLLAMGVERALTLWPEWGLAFTHLDKRVENRPMKPATGLIGKRVAFHNGAYIGGRKGSSASLEGILAMLRTAESAGWRFSGTPPSRGEHGRRGRDRRGYNDINLGRGILAPLPPAEDGAL